MEIKEELLCHLWLGNFAYKTTLSWWIFVLAFVIMIVIALLTVSGLPHLPPPDGPGEDRHGGHGIENGFCSFHDNESDYCQTAKCTNHSNSSFISTEF